MKIVTYNVNGLRQRVSQFGSLKKLLDSFDADIICFQETKLRRQELSSDLVIAPGYDSFFSCSCSNLKSRSSGYSGVATFCRVESVVETTVVALPVAAEEGFTGLVDGCNKNGRDEVQNIAPGLEEFDVDELLKIDSEGRCVITDHCHFVLFNIYGPRAGGDDTERINFKSSFYKILQKRWENLLCQDRRIIVVGDLNIAPTAMDRCDAAPDFENNEFRRWFRSMLTHSGGSFLDVFREKHADRRDAFTCWPSNTGGEQFNFGSRIDHILCAGSCLHQEHNIEGHNFVACHVKECDILSEYKRWKPGNAPRWKGGWSTKLEGSDHAPVYTSLIEIPDIAQHSTPALSSRNLPTVRGFQQTLVSMLSKRQVASQNETSSVSNSLVNGHDTIMRCCESEEKRKNVHCTSDNHTIDSQRLNNSDISSSKANEHSNDFGDAGCPNTSAGLQSDHISTVPAQRTKKKARNDRSCQLTLRSFFKKSQNLHENAEKLPFDSLANQTDMPDSARFSIDHTHNSQSNCSEHYELNSSRLVLTEDGVNGGSSEKAKCNTAQVEWQRIQQLMQSSIPLCKGHKEPCIARVVKKPGPTCGRRFYVCARAEGPASNPEANCGFFKWANSKSRNK